MRTLNRPDLPFGSMNKENPNKFTIDDRMLEGVDANFEPSFFSVKKHKDAPKVLKNPALVRRNSGNKFVRKEEAPARTLASLRKDWEESLQTEEEKIAPVVSDVIKVSKRVKAQFVSDLKIHMDSIEAFFIKEVAPIEVALVDAMERARQTVELITESDVEISSINSVQIMFQEAIRLKTFDFLCTKLQLTPHLRQVLIDKYFRPDVRK